jgi:hypothetical protein
MKAYQPSKRKSATMSRRNHFSPRHLGMESLESRQMMAGNVTASVSGGNLTVTGDGSANGIIVFQLGEGQFRVVGSNQGGAATRIRQGNSLANYQTVNGVTGDITIDMRGSNDRVTFSNTPAFGQVSNVPRDLTIFTGDGQDNVSLTRLRVGDDVRVDLGGQNDNFQISDSIVGADDGQANHNLEVFGQAGEDDILIFNNQNEVLVRGDATINTGPTNEDDEVTLHQLHVLDDLEVLTFGGGDDVFVWDCQINDDLTVDTGEGRDSAVISQSSADVIFARMGGDRDYLEIVNSSARSANLNGGTGSDDWLDLLSTQFTEEPDTFLFETVRVGEDDGGG